MITNDVQINVQVLIPTYNNVEDIDRTIESIFAQTFPKENIYIAVVDFGSTDGTYEKLLKYNRYHLAVYQSRKSVNSRTMIAEAYKLTRRVAPGGEFYYETVLRPGDYWYPEYLKTVTGVMYEERIFNPVILISEVDIEQNNGTVIRRNELFDSRRIINGNRDLIIYSEKGYLHNIMCFGGPIFTERYRMNGYNNERIWWSKCQTIGYERNAIYIPEYLSCIKERYYDDEVEEILFRWEHQIVFERAVNAKKDVTIERSITDSVYIGLAKYALWRSFLLKNRDELKQSKDCFLLAKIIYPSIENESIYKLLYELIVDNQEENVNHIKEYFDEFERVQ